MILAYKYRLLPTKRQHSALASILEDQRQLYNGALQERLECYRKTGRSLTHRDQFKGLTEWRHQDPDEAAVYPANLQRWTLKRLSDAYSGFFQQVKKRDGKAGLPRYRSTGRWRSFGFLEFSGVKLRGNRLHFKGMPGSLRVHMHRGLPDAKILACSISRDVSGWTVSFSIDITPSEKNGTGRCVGIDVGLTCLAALSDGTTVQSCRAAERGAKELRRRQRAVSRCKKWSSGYAKARLAAGKAHHKARLTRDTHLHQASAAIVGKFDIIAIENLNISGLAAGFLARSINDASWGKFYQMLHYKAERAGVQLIKVDPKFTSQECPDCGTRVKKTLSDRVHSCPCGCVLDRDIAAARVILSRAVVGPEARNVAGCGERAPRNIGLTTA